MVSEWLLLHEYGGRMLSIKKKVSLGGEGQDILTTKHPTPSKKAEQL